MNDLIISVSESTKEKEYLLKYDLGVKDPTIQQMMEDLKAWGKDVCERNGVPYSYGESFNIVYRDAAYFDGLPQKATLAGNVSLKK